MSVMLRDGCCQWCLFGPTPLLDPSGVADKIADVAATDSFFVCHEATARGVRDVMCPGWLEAAGHTSNAGRMFERLVAIGGTPPLWKPDGPAVDQGYQSLINEAKRTQRAERKR